MAGNLPVRILYIDDSPEDRDLVQYTLEKAAPGQFKLTQTGSRDDFKALLTSEEFDLVLTDFNILGFTGFQVMDLIHQARLNLPIVILTGTGSEEVAAEAIKRGAGDYVIKTTHHIRRLPQVIEAVLERKRLESQREQALIELRHSEARYHNLYDSAPFGVFHSTLQGRFIRVNQALAKMFAYDSPEDMVSTVTDINSQIFADPDRRDELKGKLVPGEWLYAQNLYRRKDGSQITCNLTVRLVEDPGGPGTYLEGFIEDISQRVQTEVDLERMRILLTTILEHAPVPIFVTTQDGHIMLVSRAWETSRGVSRGKAIGASLDEIYPPAKARQLYESNLRVIESELPIQFEESIDSPDGKHYLQTIKFPVKDQKEGKSIVAGISIDITDRIHAEDALRQSEIFNRSVLDSLSAHIVVINSLGKVIATNEAWNRFARENGARPSANHFLGVNYLDVCEHAIADGDETASRVLTGLQAVLLGKRTEFSLEYSCDSPDEKRWFVLRATALRDHSGSVVIAHENITERKLVERALQHEQHQMQTLMDNVPDTITFKDEKSRFIRVNQAFLGRIKQGDPQQVLGKTDFDFFTDEHALLAFRDEQEIIRTGQAKINMEEKETYPDHPPSWALTTKMPLHDEAGKIIGTFGVSRDITDRIRAEETRRRQNDYLRALQATTLDLVSQLDLGDLLENIVQRACQLMETPTAQLLLLDRQLSILVPSVGVGVLNKVLNDIVKPGEGLSGQVWDSSRPMVVDSYDDWPGHLVDFPRGLVTAMMGVPLISNSGILGVLELAYPNPSLRTFDSDAIEEMSQFARLAAIAIENARLFSESTERVRFIQSLRRIDQAITGTFDLHAVTDHILAELVAQLKIDAVDLLLLNPVLNVLEYYESRGFRTEFLRHSHVRVGESYAGKAALEGKLVAVPDLLVETSDLSRAPMLAEEGFISYYAVPLVSKGLVKGVLEVFQRSRLEPDTNWFDFLEAVSSQAAIAVDNSTLFADLQRSTLELSAAYDTTMQGLSRALDLRDRETGEHSLGLMRMTERLARELNVSDAELVHIRRGALLHDIGKIGVPDEILRKKGELSPDDWVVMRQHPVLAKDLLLPIEFLHPAIDIPYCHHEKWDGTGYPNGLSGEQIPLAARIFSIVDVYHALTHDRVYRDAWPHDKVIRYLREQSGQHFDPQVVEVFLSLFG